MNDSGCSQPYRNEDGDQLRQSDGTRCLKNVEVLQDIRHRHQSESTKETKTYGRGKGKSRGIRTCISLALVIITSLHDSPIHDDVARCASNSKQPCDCCVLWSTGNVSMGFSTIRKGSDCSLSRLNEAR